MKKKIIIESMMREDHSSFIIDVILSIYVLDTECTLQVSTYWLFDFENDECQFSIKSVKSSPFSGLGDSDIVKGKLESYIEMEKALIMSMCHIANGDGIMTTSDNNNNDIEQKALERVLSRPKRRSKRRSYKKLVNIYDTKDLNPGDHIVLLYIPKGNPSNIMVSDVTEGLDRNTKCVRFNTKTSEDLTTMNIKRIVVEDTYKPIKNPHKWHTIGERFECDVFSYKRKIGLKPLYESGMPVY